MDTAANSKQKTKRRPAVQPELAPAAEWVAGGRLFVGTSGWAYASWKPEFYPKTVSAKKFLEHYGTRLNSVEVNYTFRALPTAVVLASWMETVPEGFRFSFKAPEQITHRRRLRECDEAVGAFLAVLEPVRAAAKLGPVLFQLPPNFKMDVERLRSFLSAKAFATAKIPMAFEFRHASWFCDAVYAVLREFDVAVCVAESEDLVTPEVMTAQGFACYRLRMPGGYDAAAVGAFAAKFGALAAKRDVYVYLKHEEAPTGPLAAAAILRAVAR